MFSLGVSFGVSNVAIPKGGPKTVPCRVDFSASPIVEIDGEQVVARGQIEYLQGVYVDNSQYDDPFEMTMGTTGQRIICPPRSQGYFNLLVPNPPRISTKSAQVANRVINLFFYNVPIQSGVWKVTA